MRRSMKNKYRKKLDIWRKSPVIFASEVLRFIPDDWQHQVLNDLAQSSKITIASGQGVGKTALQSVALLWFLMCHRNARVVATAPTQRQLNDILWSEVDKWRERSPRLREMLGYTKTRVYLKGFENRWFAVARTATKPENMQGFHEDNMLFIVDEASGVSDPIMEVIHGTLSGANNKLLMCGNPTRTSGFFYDSHHADKALYVAYKISSLNSSRTNKENIQSLIRKFGRDSNVVRVRVDGEFPIDEDDVFITMSDINTALSTEPVLEPVELIEIGIDVARFGDDCTVIASRVNNTILPMNVRNGQDTQETAEKAVAIARQLRAEHRYPGKIYVKIDDNGVGGGVTDGIRKIKRMDGDLDWLVVMPVVFVGTFKHTHYQDFNTYLWGVLKDALSDGLIALPSDNDLIGELSCRKKSFSPNGRIKIESKDQMKKRGMQSPDRGDAVALAVLPRREKTSEERRREGKRR